MKKKKLFAVLTASCIMLASAAGCQKTPEEKDVIQKNAGVLESKIEENDATIADFKDHITDEIGEDGVNSGIDMVVDKGEAESVSIYEVRFTEFTQEQADRFLEALVGDRDFYQIPEDMSKEKLQDKIQDLEQEVEESDCGDKEYLDGKTYNELIEAYKEMYSNAVSEDNHEKASRQFVKNRYGADRIGGYYLDENGVRNEVVIANSNPSNATRHYTQMSYYRKAIENQINWIEYDGSEKALMISLGEAEAQKQAEEMVERIGAYGFSCDGALRIVAAQVAENKDEGVTCGYHFVFTRKLDGIALAVPDNSKECLEPPNRITEWFNPDGEIDMEYVSQLSWDCEGIDVVVNDNGIMLLDWHTPYEITETPIEEDVNVLSQEELTSTIKRHAAISSAGGDTLYSLTKLKLGYQKIPKENEDDTYLLVPVWQVIGDMEYSGISVNPDNGEIVEGGIIRRPGIWLWVFNALDGSVVTTSTGVG